MRFQNPGWFTRTLSFTSHPDSERCHLVFAISVVEGSHGSVKELLIMPPVTITNSTDRAIRVRLESADSDDPYEMVAEEGMERIPERAQPFSLPVLRPLRSRL
jgi:hypothetical protein